MHEDIEREARRAEIRNFLEAYDPMPADPSAVYICRVDHRLESIVYLLLKDALVILHFNMKNTEEKGFVQRVFPLGQIQEVTLASKVLPHNTSSYETGGSIRLETGEEFVLPDPDVEKPGSAERDSAVAFLRLLVSRLAEPSS